jgi:hypothetical protein
VCPDCHQGHCPRDRELDVEGVACSPRDRPIMARVANDTTSRPRFSAPSNWIYQKFAFPPFLFSTSRWTAQACPW